MQFENYTDRAKGFVQAAQTIAVREGHQKFLPDHVLKALLDDEQGMAAGLIQRAGGDAKAVMGTVERTLARQPKVSGDGAGQLYLDQATAKLFDEAEQIAKKAGDSYVTVERLLLALSMAKGSDAARALEQVAGIPEMSVVERQIQDLALFEPRAIGPDVRPERAVHPGAPERDRADVLAAGVAQERGCALEIRAIAPAGSGPRERQPNQDERREAAEQCPDREPPMACRLRTGSR